MRVCARAPMRVDPAGGGTDAPPFSTEHGGAVVNFGVSRYAYAMAERLPRGAGIVLYSTDLDQGVVAGSVAEMARGNGLEFLQAFVRRLVPEEDSILLLTESDVPRGSGLGGSGAVGVAVVAALDRLYGRERPREETAALANEVERGDLRYAGGNQDSFGAAFGGMNLLEYPRGGGTRRRELRVSDGTRRALEHASLLVYTGAAHVSGSIHEDIRKSYSEVDSATRRALENLREAALEMARALEGDDLDGYLGALNASCANLYALHESCDSPGHRRCIEALDGLALGAKTCGAGGGGFLLVHARPGRRRECIRGAEAMGALVWPVCLDRDGVVSWRERPAPPAEVERLRRRIEERG